MQRPKRLRKKHPILFLLFVFFLLGFLPVFGRNVTELRLYRSHTPDQNYITYYALQPDGDLISWGKGPLDHNRSNDFFGVYPYFLRQKIVCNVTDFACTPFVILYVDRNRVLWGSGMDEEILHSEESGQVRIMEDVERVAADARYALALKTDGSVWAWPGYSVVKFNRQQGMEPSNSTPVKIAEDMQAIFTEADFYFALTKENTLVRLNLSGGKPAPLAGNVKEVSCLYTWGKNLLIYLTRQGEVYPINARNRERIAENVASLCENGLVKTDGSLWKWEGSFADGGLIKVRRGVRTAVTLDFYLDRLGRLHWRSNFSYLPPPPRSVLWLDTIARNASLLALVWLYYCRQKRTVREAQTAIEETDWN